MLFSSVPMALFTDNRKLNFPLFWATAFNYLLTKITSILAQWLSLHFYYPPYLPMLFIKKDPYWGNNFIYTSLRSIIQVKLHYFIVPCILNFQAESLYLIYQSFCSLSTLIQQFFLVILMQIYQWKSHLNGSCLLRFPTYSHTEAITSKSSNSLEILPVLLM